MTTGKLSTASPISNTNTNETHGEIDADRDREYSETNPLLRRDQVRNETGPLEGAEAEERMQKLVSRMKIQIWAGMGCGMLIASGIGAAFIAVVGLPTPRSLRTYSRPVLLGDGQFMVRNGTNLGRSILRHSIRSDIHHGNCFLENGSI